MTNCLAISDEYHNCSLKKRHIGAHACDISGCNHRWETAPQEPPAKHLAGSQSVLEEAIFRVVAPTEERNRLHWDEYRLSEEDLNRLINEVDPATELAWAVKDLLCAHYAIQATALLDEQSQQIGIKVIEQRKQDNESLTELVKEQSKLIEELKLQLLGEHK